ncbi:hypothetical protein D3C78_788470 [compost metagenome]
MVTGVPSVGKRESDALTPTLSHGKREQTLKTATRVAVLLLPTPHPPAQTFRTGGSRGKNYRLRSAAGVWRSPATKSPARASSQSPHTAAPYTPHGELRSAGSLRRAR